MQPTLEAFPSPLSPPASTVRQGGVLWETGARRGAGSAPLPSAGTACRPAQGIVPGQHVSYKRAPHQHPFGDLVLNMP